MLNRVSPPPAAKQEKTPVMALPRMTLTVDELAQEMNISRPTAYDLVKRKGFPSFTIGHRVLVNRAGLQRWIDEQCASQAA